MTPLNTDNRQAYVFFFFFLDKPTVELLRLFNNTLTDITFCQPFPLPFSAEKCQEYLHQFSTALHCSNTKFVCGEGIRSYSYS